MDEKLADLHKDDVQQHPLKSFGYGIEQWHQLLWSLIQLFIPITMLALAMIYINSSMGNLEGGSLPYVPGFSLGNFEGAFSSCISQPLGVDNRNQSMSCPKGTITSLVHFGAIRGDNKTMTLKRQGPFENWNDADREFGNNYCGSPDLIEDEDSCSGIIPVDFRANFEHWCLGKETCSYNLNDGLTKTGQPEVCTRPETIVYAQVACTMTNDQ